MRLSIALEKTPNLTPTARDAFGWIPAAIGLIVILLGVATLGANLLTAHALRNRTHRTLCLVTAAANLVQFPVGTLLGVASLIVLGRPAVKAAFADKREAPDVANAVFSASPRAVGAGFPPAERAQ